MKTIAMVFGVLSLAGGVALADAKGAKKDAKKEDPNAAMMAAMAKHATPTEQHKLLTSLAGTWTVAGKFYMGPKPSESTSTAEVKSILGGLFTSMELTGTFMGKPFAGRGVNGYDTVQQKFVSTWVDSMGSWMMNAVGTADATGKVITWTSTELDPMTGKPVSHKMVTKIESDKKYTEEMFKVADGKETKEMELVYTRK
jgi:hypothetical protein